MFNREGDEEDLQRKQDELEAKRKAMFFMATPPKEERFSYFTQMNMELARDEL